MSQRIMAYLLFPALALSLLAGCALSTGKGRAGTMIASSEAFKYFSGDYSNSEYFLAHKPQTVAVLPFRDAIERSVSFAWEEDPAGIVRRGFYNHVSSLPFKDLELYEVDKRLANAGLDDPAELEKLARTDPGRLKSALGVDAVFMGDVTHFDRIYAGIFSQVAVGCDMQLIDLDNGKMLWNATNVSRAVAGGASLDPIGLAMAAVAAVWNLREVEMLRQTDDLFREIVSTIQVPETELAGAVRPPALHLFTVLNPKPYYTAGNEIAFRIVGDPGCKAYVDLGAFQRGVALSPVSPEMKAALEAQVLEVVKQRSKDTGHELTDDVVAALRKGLAEQEIYEGSFTVEPGQQALGLFAKGYLVNDGGGQAFGLDTVHVVNVDAVPPAAVTGLKTRGLDDKAQLSWDKLVDPTLKGYQVMASATALTGFAQTAQVESPEAMVGNLTNFTPVFFQVRAVDKAGNLGPASESVKVVPLPMEGLYELPKPGSSIKGGPLMGKALLVKANGPFTVLAPLVIGKSSALYVEPGVVIRFAPGAGIQVKGGDLMVFGAKNAPVVLEPSGKKAGPGAWSGVALDGAKRVVLRYARIEKARYGVDVKNSSPELHGVAITRCSQAGLRVDDGGKPVMTCSRLEGNQGSGALLIEGKGVAPQLKNNLFRNNDFQVQCYAPVQIDLRSNYWSRSAPNAAFFTEQPLLDPMLNEPPACVQ
ncbi:MAG: hypothetical protein PWQ57_447 [Desulfovibrionales bacterium]|nr:hypothetical protein [Desulfovibrionales bacterium]